MNVINDGEKIYWQNGNELLMLFINTKNNEKVELENYIDLCFIDIIFTYSVSATSNSLPLTFNAFPYNYLSK